MRSHEMAGPVSVPGKADRDHLVVGGVIASHSLPHVYTQGFAVILPIIAITLGLPPVAALVQIAARDSGEGRQLEGSLLGLRWGNNARFIGFATLLATSLGYTFRFWYSAGMSTVAALTALLLPSPSRA